MTSFIYLLWLNKVWGKPVILKLVHDLSMLFLSENTHNVNIVNVYCKGMFSFNDEYLQDIRACEMKNFDRPILYLQDMSVGPTPFRTEFPLLPNCTEITLD